MKKASSIKIEWDDGSTSMAEGEVAAAIMDWYGACETMNLIHGAVYEGPHFTVMQTQGNAAGEGGERQK